jgi:hypothetical protein
MYSGYMASRKRRVPNSAGVFMTEDLVYKCLPSFTKSIASFAALCHYLSSMGCPGDLLWEFGCAMIGSLGTSFLVICGLTIKPGKSLKCLSRDVTTRSHGIAIFPNTQLAVSFDRVEGQAKSNLARVCDASSNRYSMQQFKPLRTQRTSSGSSHRTGVRREKMGISGGR